ncbi:MAG: DinB family protein [Candidatus Heimdallarchaeota archaeon]
MASDRKVVPVLEQELEYRFQELLNQLAMLSKTEAKWLPTRNSMTLETIKMWNAKGSDWLEAQRFDPLSTIEFKVIHLAHCKIMYDDYAFREGKLKWSTLDSPEWPVCVNYLEETQNRLMESIRLLTDQQLKQEVSTNWGDLWPIKKIIFTMIHHDSYHHGQINTIRKLYRTKKESF